MTGEEVEVNSKHREFYAAITLDCLDCLRQKVSQWLEDLCHDEGPHWRYTLAAGKSAKGVILAVEGRVAQKRPYRKAADLALINACADLETIVSTLSMIFSESLFQGIHFYGDMLRWRFLEAFDAPGCLDLEEGVIVVARLKTLYRDIVEVSERVSQMSPYLRDVLSQNIRLAIPS